MFKTNPKLQNCLTSGKPIVTRLAPSPTGLLHLGNAWSFLVCWLAARTQKGIVILRIDDIDSQRSRAAFADSIIKDLHWLGLDWDLGPETSDSCYQSRRNAIYQNALKILQAENLVYPCFCTRRELAQMASAPHAEDMGPPYMGKCSQLSSEEVKTRIAAGRQYSQRFKTSNNVICFNDIVQGKKCYDRAAYGGDFPVKRADGIWSYQFATAVDDGEMCVNLVVRGRDLLSSTPPQIQILRHLSCDIPAYAHLPLLLTSTGQRLAKRHKSLSLLDLRYKGINPQAITGLLAKLGGFNPSGGNCSPASLIDKFDFNCLPAQDIYLSSENLAALGTSD